MTCLLCGSPMTDTSAVHAHAMHCPVRRDAAYWQIYEVEQISGDTYLRVPCLKCNEMIAVRWNVKPEQIISHECGFSALAASFFSAGRLHFSCAKCWRDHGVIPLEGPCPKCASRVQHAYTRAGGVGVRAVTLADGTQVPIASATYEAIDHPSHYGGADNPYEAIKVIEAWNLDFCLGNTVKYISRAGRKDAAKHVEDLKKARWYLDRAIARLEGRT